MKTKTEKKTETKNANPYEIDIDELNKQESENKPKTSGLICPKRNFSINEPCKVCDYITNVIYASNFPDEHPARKFASERKAKSGIFLNIVLPSNPKKAIVLEIGTELGNALMYNIKNKKGWNIIANPLKNAGRMITITKRKREGGKDNYFKYEVDLDPDVVDWEIPEEVRENLPNLDQDNLIKMLREGEFNDANYMHVKTIKPGETFTCRICPSWTTGAKGDENRRIMEYVWRHWNVSEAQISGEETIDWKAAVKKDKETEEKLPWEEQDAPPQKEEAKKPPVKAKKPECFGDSTLYEVDDTQTCMPCPYFKECGEKVKE